MDIKEILEQLTEEEIISFMEYLGAETSNRSNSKELIFTSICHNSDSYKLYYYIESRTFHCYSNCGNIGNLINLLIHIKQYEVKDAINEIKQFFGYDSTPTLRRGFRIKKERKKLTVNDVTLQKIDSPEKAYVYTLHKQIPIKEFELDGISFRTIKKFDIRYDIKNNQIVIPHFCPFDDKRVIGIRCRELDENKIERFGKYHPYYFEGNTYAHKLGENLYGLNFTKDNIKKYKKAIIVEGEKGVMQLQNMYPNTNISVALCGSNMSLYQKKLLIDLDVKECLFALDKQYQTIEEMNMWRDKIIKMASDLIQNGVECYMLLDDIQGLIGYKDSPVDCGKEIFEKLIKNKIRIEDKNS